MSTMDNHSNTDVGKMAKPREKSERKRGKKKRGANKEPEPSVQPQPHTQEDFIPLHADEDEAPDGVDTTTAEEPSSSSWMIDRRSAQKSETSAPFGLVEPDLKAYLRSAHVRLQELVAAVVDEGRHLDEDEETKALRNAMLDEIKGKELILATDADTSLILEDLLCTFGERQTRILADALAKDFKTVAIHRFGSHLLQSTISSLQACISRETVAAAASTKVASKTGDVLRLASQLVIDMAASVHGDAEELVEQQFASHVVRSLLLVLASRSARDNSLRSKRSRKFAKSNKFADLTQAEDDIAPAAPARFDEELRKLIAAIKSQLTDEARVRSMCVDAIASPTLALVIELDAMNGKGKGRESLLYACLDGPPRADADRSAHVETLLRDSVGSHLLEHVVKSLDTESFDAFWAQYIQGRLSKLGVHPTANFIIAAAIGRASPVQLEEACKDIAENGAAMVEHHCLGVLTAAVHRGSELTQGTEAKAGMFWSTSRIDCQAVHSVFKAFGFDADRKGVDDALLLKAILTGKNRKDLKRIINMSKRRNADKPKHKSKKRKHGDDDGESKHGGQLAPLLAKPTIPGSLLCQAIAKLAAPAQEPLLECLLNLEKLSVVATDATAVHIVLAFLRSSNLTFQQRSKLSGAALAELENLLNDKFGSRVIDDVFDHSDLFFKDKMAKACVNAERKLLSSTYGRFFLKRIQLALYRRDIDQWKATIKAQQQARREAEQAAAAEVAKLESTAEGASNEDGVHAAKKQKKAKSKVDEDLEAILAGV